MMNVYIYKRYNYNDEKVVIEVVSIKTENELINNYNMINKIVKIIEKALND